AAAGLFRRAILESGAASTVDGTERATEVAQKFLAAVGCEVGELRDVPAAELLAAQEAIAGSLDEGLNFVPVIDGVVLPDAPLARLRDGSAAGVDVLIGTNADEMTMFLLLEPALAQLSPEGFGARIDAPFADKGLAPGTADATYRQRLGDATPTEVLTAVAGDQTFRIPAIRLAEAQVAAGGAAWMYLFTYPSPAAGGMLKSSHALEIPFAWDNLDAAGVALFAGEVGESHRALATAMADAWVAFATEGLPAAVGLPDWPAYDTERRATMRLDVGASEVLDDPWGPERALWDGLDP
ncbi:MAG TPA: carboxylesterase family protein, partial [Acidimicrobiales bacterium]